MGLPTTGYAVHLMLNKKVDERHKGAEEGAGEDFPVPDSSWIPRA
jgi:hypothetical protein